MPSLYGCCKPRPHTTHTHTHPAAQCHFTSVLGSIYDTLNLTFHSTSCIFKLHMKYSRVSPKYPIHSIDIRTSFPMELIDWVNFSSPEPTHQSINVKIMTKENSTEIWYRVKFWMTYSGDGNDNVHLSLMDLINIGCQWPYTKTSIVCQSIISNRSNEIH